MRPIDMARIIGGKRYDTRTATLLASDVYWDGHTMERHGRNTWLYRTRKGAYFALHRSQWQGEHDTIRPLDVDEAQALYERMADHAMAEVDFEQAFPNAEVVDAKDFGSVYSWSNYEWEVAHIFRELTAGDSLAVEWASMGRGEETLSMWLADYYSREESPAEAACAAFDLWYHAHNSRLDPSGDVPEAPF